MTGISIFFGFKKSIKNIFLSVQEEKSTLWICLLEEKLKTSSVTIKIKTF